MSADIPDEWVEKGADALDQALDDLYAENAPEMVTQVYRKAVQKEFARVVLEAVWPDLMRTAEERSWGDGDEYP